MNETQSYKGYEIYTKSWNHTYKDTGRTVVVNAFCFKTEDGIEVKERDLKQIKHQISRHVNKLNKKQGLTV